jgi:hypothetical protein
MAQQRRPTAALIGAAVLLTLALAVEAFVVAPGQKLQQELLSQGQQQQHQQQQPGSSSRTGVRTLVARAPEFGRKQVSGSCGLGFSVCACVCVWEGLCAVRVGFIIGGLLEGPGLRCTCICG